MLYVDVEPFRLRAVYSAARTAELAGISYRRLDYLAREGVLEPSVRKARGCGTRRLYSDADVARVRLASVLRDLGAPLDPTVRRALEQLPPDPDDWPEFLFVEASGVLRANRPAGPACLMVTTRWLLDPVRWLAAHPSAA